MSAVPSTTGSTLITCVYNDEVYGGLLGYSADHIGRLCA